MWCSVQSLYVWMKGNLCAGFLAWAPTVMCVVYIGDLVCGGVWGCMTVPSNPPPLFPWPGFWSCWRSAHACLGSGMFSEVGPLAVVISHCVSPETLIYTLMKWRPDPISVSVPNCGLPVALKITSNARRTPNEDFSQVTFYRAVKKLKQAWNI